MKTRPLGNSDLNITPIGFGAWAIGGSGWDFGWGPQDDTDSIATIHDAIDLGINWIDTAAIYGLGHSESVVARALDGMANKPYVFTKCERVWNEKREIGKSLKRESIFRECEASLKRLNTEVIDLYQIHWPEPDEDVEEGWQAVLDLKQQGKIRFGGVSNFSASQMERAQKLGPITSNQPPYSLLRREIEAEVLPHCEETDVGVIVYSPMQSGLLTGAWSQERKATLAPDDWRHKARYFQEPMFTRGLKLAELLRQIGAPHSVTPGAMAIAWTLAHPAVTGAIVGARKPGQLAELVAGASIELTPTERARLETELS